MGTVGTPSATSLLSWERGLKSTAWLAVGSGYPSLLSWERGLKYGFIIKCASLIFVAPLVGAWIEMMNVVAKGASMSVAPLVGAWIEIFCEGDVRMTVESLLSWERGLK